MSSLLSLSRPSFSPSLPMLAALAVTLSPHAGALAQSAHEHGAAYLNLALDGEHLLLEFQAPAADLVGFEHAPEDAQQQQLHAEVRARLQDANWLLTLPAEAQCRLNEATVITGHETGEQAHSSDAHHRQPDRHGSSHHHQAPAHASHEYESHAHEPHDHAEAHATAHHDDAGHTDWLVTWHYQCSAPQHLTEVLWLGFEPLSSITEVRAQGVVGTRQLAQTLTPRNPSVSLQP